MAAALKTHKVRTALGAAALACLIGAASACAPFGAHDKNSPAWFKSRLQETQKKPYPRLADVPPTPPPSSRTPAQWDAIGADVARAGAALDASPRSAPPEVTPEATAAFEEQARKEAAGQRPAP
jgi:hypothetical protein